MPTNAKTSTQAATNAESSPKASATKIGLVESDKRSKTRTVVVRYKAMHPKYGKYMSKKTVLQVHDEANESRLGDTVEVKPCRPLSKTKRWTLVRVVERSRRVEPIAS